jgi:hypothetical protein
LSSIRQLRLWGNVVAGGAVVSGNTPINAATTAASSLNTNFTDGKAAYSPIVGTAFRGEWKAFGDWSNDIDFTARAVDKDLLVFGGGLDYTDAVSSRFPTLLKRSTSRSSASTPSGWITIWRRPTI